MIEAEGQVDSNCNERPMGEIRNLRCHIRQSESNAHQGEEAAIYECIDHERFQKSNGDHRSVALLGYIIEFWEPLNTFLVALVAWEFL